MKNIICFLAFAVLSLGSAQTSLERFVFATSDHEGNFRKFLDQWGREYAPSAPKNDTAKIVYATYQQLFTPFALDGKSSFNSDKKINDGYRYVVVPGSIAYYVSTNGRDSDRDLTRFIIEEFRPALDFGKKVKVLYLTDKYDSILNEFLGKESTKFGAPSVMSPSRAEGKSAEREALVKKFLPIVHGHWGAYWHLTTAPGVAMVFNRTFTKVEVRFRIGYGGRINEYERQPDGTWRVIEKDYIREWVE